MDKKARAMLVATIAEQCKLGKEIAVPLDLFFTGNNDNRSIGGNLGDRQPTIGEFRRTLAALRDRPEVKDVLIRVTDVGDEESWPHADTVYVISSLSLSDIEAALSNLKFAEIVSGWLHEKPAAVSEPEDGFTVHSLWWD